jgi:uncharacterized protein YaeQ
MALAPVRMEYRIQLAHVDRGRDVSETVVVGRHPSETAEHLALRVLAWCLLNEDRLELGPGLSTPDAADLWARDLTGRLTTWIECGAAQGEKLRRVLQQNAGAQAHVVLSDARRRDELHAEVGAWKRSLPLTIWMLDPALVAALAAIEERRQRWSVTVVGDHLYVDAGGTACDGEARRSEPGDMP